MLIFVVHIHWRCVVDLYSFPLVLSKTRKVFIILEVFYLINKTFNVVHYTFVLKCAFKCCIWEEHAGIPWKWFYLNEIVYSK